MKKIIPYLKPYQRISIMAPLLKLTEVIFGLLVPYILINAIELAILPKQMDKMLHYFILLLLLSLAGYACAVAAQYFSAKASARFAGDLRLASAEHIQKMSVSTLNQFGTSSLYTRLTTDLNQIQTGLNLTLRLLLPSPFVVFGAAFMAFRISHSLGLLYFLLIPLLFLIVGLILKVTLPRINSLQQLLEQISLFVQDNITGSRVLRAFRKEKNEVIQFDEKLNQYRSNDFTLNTLSNLLNPITGFIINCFICLILYLGALKVQTNGLNQGQLVALTNYITIIIVELIKFANLIVTLSKSINSSRRIEEVLEAPIQDTHKGKDLSAENAFEIQFEDISFHYPDAKELSLSYLNIDIHQGETIGIIGGIGSGKSTLVHLLTGLYAPTSGTIRMNGNPLDSYSLESIRKTISLIPQKAQLVSGTIRSNINWRNMNADDQELYECLKVAQAYDFVIGKENQLDETVEKNGLNLSGGQKQRLSIARGLLNKPPILILDDSFSALDYVTEKNLRKEIYQLSWNPTVILISQRISSIQDADRILVLDNGSVCGYSTHNELMKTCQVYQEIAHSQGVTK